MQHPESIHLNGSKATNNFKTDFNWTKYYKKCLKKPKKELLKPSITHIKNKPKQQNPSKKTLNHSHAADCFFCIICSCLIITFYREGFFLLQSVVLSPSSAFSSVCSNILHSYSILSHLFFTAFLPELLN